MQDTVEQRIPNGVNGAHDTQNGELVNGQPPQKSDHSGGLVLDQATAAEVQTQAKNNGVAWRAALNPEAYLRREEYLATQGLAKNAGITYWVLVDPKQEKKPRDVLAGCETLKKRAIVSHNGKLQDVIAHGVGSVFTPPAFRGHGYGGIMMQKLSLALQHWRAEETPCLFSILYSDIGKKFYAKNGGWHPFPSAHIHLRPESAIRVNVQPEAKPLFEDDLPELCAADEAMIRESMAKCRRGTTVALIPDHKTMEWHHARENFVSNELYGKRPMVKGAITHVGQDRIWGIFTRVWQNEDPKNSAGNTLHVLRLVMEDHTGKAGTSGWSEAHLAGVASILRFAQREAHEWTMEEIELWNPRPAIVEAAKLIDAKAKVQERETDSICCLRWYGPSDTEVEWLENEKYGWC